MSDGRLRDLERRFRETQSPGDEVAWVSEQLRTGELSRERVLLAASWNDTLANALFSGSEVPPIEFGPEEQRSYAHDYFQSSMNREHAWVRLVASLGDEPFLRILLALGRLALPEWSGPDARWAAEVFRASEDYVRTRGPEQALALRGLGRQSPAREELCTPRDSALGSDFPVENLADRVYWSYKGILRDPGFGAYYAVSGVERWTNMFAVDDGPETPAIPERYLAMAHSMVLCEGLNGAVMVTSSARVLARLRDEVSPWLLGRGDPLQAL
jgi:hypothetical protein